MITDIALDLASNQASPSSTINASTALHSDPIGVVEV